MRFEGMVLFCTGGASGIGEQVCRRFVADGGKAAVVDLDGEKAERVAADLEGAIGIAADISDERAVAAAVERAHSELGGAISSVYNGAGNLSVGTIEEVTVAQYRAMLDVHAIGTYVVCREALPQLRRAEGAAIVNTASVVALQARAQLAPYGAAKGAVLAFSRQLALELAPDVRVNSVSPGRTVTGMTKSIYEGLGDGDLAAGMVKAGEEVMINRVADPAELAAAICFLLSADANYVTGTDFVVDGGMTAE